MIHRAVLGSLERFMAMLIEHYAGKFPLWLNPVQVKILPVSDDFNAYADKLRNQMLEKGIRAAVDTRSESIPKKVREAQKEKVNYVVVVGEKEQHDSTVTVRTRDNVVHDPQKADAFIREIVEEIAQKK